MIFTMNTTESLNLAIKGCTQPGDHIITTSMEHNSVARPLKELEKINISTTYVRADSQGKIDPTDIRKAIRVNTRLIVTTHASNVTGTLVPVQEIGKIAREHGILYLVDAAQTAGIIPINLSTLPVDMMAMPGHKGLLGPQGTGVLYLAPHVRLKQLKEGARAVSQKASFNPSSYRTAMNRYIKHSRDCRTGCRNKLYNKKRTKYSARPRPPYRKVFSGCPA